jgi:hypothetical protein
MAIKRYKNLECDEDSFEKIKDLIVDIEGNYVLDGFIGIHASKLWASVLQLQRIDKGKVWLVNTSKISALIDEDPDVFAHNNVLKWEIAHLARHVALQFMLEDNQWITSE